MECNVYAFIMQNTQEQFVNNYSNISCEKSWIEELLKIFCWCTFVMHSHKRKLEYLYIYAKFNQQLKELNERIVESIFLMHSQKRKHFYKFCIICIHAKFQLKITQELNRRNISRLVVDILSIKVHVHFREAVCKNGRGEVGWTRRA